MPALPCAPRAGKTLYPLRALQEKPFKILIGPLKTRGPQEHPLGYVHLNRSRSVTQVSLAARGPGPDQAQALAGTCRARAEYVASENWVAVTEFNIDYHSRGIWQRTTVLEYGSVH